MTDTPKPSVEEFLEKARQWGLNAKDWGKMVNAFYTLDARCKAGDIPRDYCTWEGLLTILDTVYPESVFPTTRKKDEPDRDPGPRIIALLRWVDELREMNRQQKNVIRHQRQRVRRRDKSHAALAPYLSHKADCESLGWEELSALKCTCGLAELEKTP